METPVDRPARQSQVAHVGVDSQYVAFIPGAIHPAAISYGKLLSIVSGEVEFILKDYELYADEAPPAHWVLSTEVEAVRRMADIAGFDTFHIVGYAEGASVALWFASKYPQRLRSIALIEPSWIGNYEMTPEEVQYRSELGRLLDLPAPDFFEAYLKSTVRPGVQLPQLPSSKQEWMARRPLGVQFFIRAFGTTELLEGRLRQYERPVYVAIGDLSHPVEQAMAKRLTRIFPDCSVEVYEGTHHLAPPHMERPDRFANALREVWKSAI